MAEIKNKIFLIIILYILFIYNSQLYNILLFYFIDIFIAFKFIILLNQSLILVIIFENSLHNIPLIMEC